MVELVLEAPQQRIDAASDALVDELGALAVSVEDADAETDAETDAERALYGEPGLPAPGPGWRRSLLKALFADGAQAAAAAAALVAQPAFAGVAVRSIDAVPDLDWVRLTQSQFAPVEVARGFWIVPSWHVPPADARRAIRLDPGLAFGTGTHPTTRMCLRWIARRAGTDAARWTRVLDYGSGSGILAIGAALHGAGTHGIDAVDIDPAAVDATRANAAANGVALAAGPPDAAEGVYPLVLANILASPLVVLAPLIASHVAPGGDLVLAGILERQTDALAAAYAPWCDLSVDDRDDGWALMTARRAGR